MVLGLMFSVSAEENLIPSWIKNTAGFWVNDQISDSEFINALQFLVKEGILVIPHPTLSSDIPFAPDPNMFPEIPIAPSLDDTLSLNSPSFSPFPSLSTNVTERIDGPFALQKIDEMNVFTLTADKEKMTELLLKETSESQFLLGVLAIDSWDGIIVDGDSKISIHGDNFSLIPFSCDYDETWMYDVNIQKQTDEGPLTVFVFKNEVRIDISETISPFGTITLDGDCTNPPLSELNTEN